MKKLEKTKKKKQVIVSALIKTKDNIHVTNNYSRGDNVSQTKIKSIT
jgi:hypothetical protein